MVLLEMSIAPLGVGESLSRYIAQCVDIIDKSGLDYRVHAMGSIVEGELDQVLDLLRQCVETISSQCNRVTVTARLDYRHGRSGQIGDRLTSLERALGRPVKK